MNPTEHVLFRNPYRIEYLWTRQCNHVTRKEEEDFLGSQVICAIKSRMQNKRGTTFYWQNELNALLHRKKGIHTWCIVVWQRKPEKLWQRVWYLFGFIYMRKSLYSRPGKRWPTDWNIPMQVIDVDGNRYSSSSKKKLLLLKSCWQKVGFFFLHFLFMTETNFFFCQVFWLANSFSSIWLQINYSQWKVLNSDFTNHCLIFFWLSL